jgi:hypothetical protein
MNRKNVLFALIAAALAGQAFAQDPAAFRYDFVSTMSPEAVQAEFAAFKKAGVNPWSGAYDPLKYFASKLSREAVSADYIALRAEVAALTGEDSGSAWLAVAGTRTVSDTLASAR